MSGDPPSGSCDRVRLCHDLSSASGTRWTRPWQHASPEPAELAETMRSTGCSLLSIPGVYHRRSARMTDVFLSPRGCPRLAKHVPRTENLSSEFGHAAVAAVGGQACGSSFQALPGDRARADGVILTRWPPPLRARPRTIESDIVEFLIERLAASWWAQLFARMTFGVRPIGLRGDHCACMCDGCVSSKSAIEGPAGCGIGRCRQGTGEWPNRYNATLLFVWMHVEV